MIRLITFLLFVNFASCCLLHKFDHGHGLCVGWRSSTDDGDNDFVKLAKAVNYADNLLKTSCTKSPYRRTRVNQGLDFYVLKYYLQEFDENSISVKIKYRVINVTAQKEGFHTFEDLWILPDSVNMSKAKWYFKDGLLRVLIPYKYQLKTEVILTCDDTEQTLIHVPKLEIYGIESRSLK